MDAASVLVLLDRLAVIGYEGRKRGPAKKRRDERFSVMAIAGGAVPYSDGRIKKTNIVIPTAAKCYESRSRRPRQFRKGNLRPRRVHWSKEAKGKNTQQARTG